MSNCGTLTGFVTGDLKAQILAAADLFVLPSYYENFGIAVAEAMVVGKPVVISDQVHIHGDISCSESGWVVPCKIPPLVQALGEALTDPGERIRRGRNAQKWAIEQYSWDAITTRTLQAYGAILNRNLPAE